MSGIKKITILMATVAVTPVFFVVAIIIALIVRAGGIRQQAKPRLVWGSIPIISHSYWSKAMRLAGYQSETFTNGYYDTIHKREDWDILVQEKYLGLPHGLKSLFAFLESLFRYDVFFLTFEGFFIGTSPLCFLQALLFRIAGKKTVLIPYGGDSYVYRRIRSTSLLHGLLMSYPAASRQQERIAARVDYWCTNASVVITGLMGPDGFGRWDVLALSPVHLDISDWKKTSRESSANGVNDVVFVAHAPNHRGFKGTEFIIDAVRILRAEGLKIELVLIEKMQNSVVKEVLETKVDILVEQLIATGHGLNALEGMASGLPVICNLEDETYLLPFRRWSYFSECPLVSACPETLVDVLRKLVSRPELRRQLGIASREYVEKYHGLDSAQYLFGEVIDHLYGRRESLINLYHPLLGEYPKRKPRVEHPLVNNRIVD